MNEDRYDAQMSDALERDIVRELGERQRKEKMMAQWKEQESAPRRNTFRLPVFASVAVAACVALLLVFAPWQKSGPSPLNDWMAGETEETRAAFPGHRELAQALSAEDYNGALEIIDKTIEQNQQEIDQLESQLAENEDEELLYELGCAQTSQDEASWVRICLLIQLQRQSDAAEDLEKYCDRTDHKAHIEEAKKLLRLIKTGKL